MVKSSMHRNVPAGASEKGEGSERRKRMTKDERAAFIVNEAVIFFAEHGFKGTTRELANRIGMKQPLLYRYFPSKESLVDRVYDEVYLRRWRPEWDHLITDRSRPLSDRLRQFYKEYARAVYDYVWVRIFIYSGLKGVDINDRYLAIVRTRVLEPVCRELRHENGLPGVSEVPISDEELELAWGLHGGFFYRAIRRFVYNMESTILTDDAIENDVRVFLAGVPGIHRQVLAKTAKPCR